jgi:hypothetical protein
MTMPPGVDTWYCSTAADGVAPVQLERYHFSPVAWMKADAHGEKRE